MLTNVAIHLASVCLLHLMLRFFLRLSSSYVPDLAWRGFLADGAVLKAGWELGFVDTSQARRNLGWVISPALSALPMLFVW